MRVIQERVVALLLVVFLTSCASLQHASQSLSSDKTLPWIESLQGQLLVMEPLHRWQVLIQWQASLEKGVLRLTHAASGRVADIQWQNQRIQMRDNQGEGLWQPVTLEQLMQMGIVVAPWELAAIFHQQVPKPLDYLGDGVWKGVLHGSLVRIRWQQEEYKLTMVDMTHGRTAILRINP